MTWTCDNCGNPNFMSDTYCHVCGSRRPSRYGKRKSIYYKTRKKGVGCVKQSIVNRSG